MRLVKPSWVSHGGQAIFAIHVHPDGTRFATGGGDHKAVIWTFPPLLSPEAESDPSLALAVIWSLAPLLSPEAESDAALPSRLATLCDHFGAVSSVSSVRWAGSGKEWEGVKRCGVGEGLGRKVHESGLSSHLATLCDHFGAVSSVRWSHSGLYLPTAADDQTVHVHGRRKGRGSVVFVGMEGMGWELIISSPCPVCENPLSGGPIMDCIWQQQRTTRQCMCTAGESGGDGEGGWELADDQTVHVYGRREGRGSVVFGEMDAPNVENWTLMHSLRGHTGEVVSPFASPAAALSYICENEEVNWGRQAGGVGERDVRGDGCTEYGRPAPNVEDNWTLMHSLASAVLALTLPALLFGEMHAPNVENWALMHSLRGHTGEVVDVDWSPDDSLIATCSTVDVDWSPDDSLVATCSLDSTVDVDWSPDDSLIATCSLDSTVRIWQPMTGRQVAVLTGHSSFVKGVAWDPIGRFLGSQSDDKSVIVWRVNDWSVAKRVEGPYPKSVGATFFRRLSFSPCGSYLTTVHAFADPNHTAAILDRTLGWAKTLDYVGHTGPVTVARYSPVLYRTSLGEGRPGRGGSEGDGGRLEAVSALYLVTEKGKGGGGEGMGGGGKEGSGVSGWKGEEGREAGEGTKGDEARERERVWEQEVKEREQEKERVRVEEERKRERERERVREEAMGMMRSGPYGWIALGGMDRKVTLWPTYRPSPLFTAKNLFKQPVLDTAWSPCGLHMLCCSADGTVAAFLFDQSELGIPLTHREMDGRIASLYGHRHVAASHSLVEDPELLALQQQVEREEAAAAAAAAAAATTAAAAAVFGNPKVRGDTTPSDLLCSLNGHVLWRDRLPSPVTAIAGCPTLFLPFRPPLLLTNQTPLTLTCSVPSTAMCCGGTDCFILSLPFPTVLPTPPSLPLPHPDTTPSDLLCSLNGHVLWRDRLPSPVTAIAGCDPAVSAHPSTLSPSPGASLWAVACSLSFLVRLPLRLSPFRPTAASSLPSTLSSSSPGASLWAVACANHSLLVRLLLLAQPLPVTAIAGCPPSSAASHPSTLSPSPGASLWAVACSLSFLVRLPLLPGESPSQTAPLPPHCCLLPSLYPLILLSRSLPLGHGLSSLLPADACFPKSSSIPPPSFSPGLLLNLNPVILLHPIQLFLTLFNRSAPLPNAPKTDILFCRPTPAS
ncbi:unnamed protein product [Closterium sp. NIES-64]|nr:unnamed protein product [Closterium sp. NIES-64]